MRGKLRKKYLDFEVKRLRNKARRNWKRNKNRGPFTGPRLYLTNEQYDRYVRLATERYNKRYNFGKDMTPSELNPKGPDAAKELDEINAEYKEVIPTYYGPDGLPRDTGPFVEN